MASQGSALIAALCRLRSVAASNECAILAALGPDSKQDAPSTLIVKCAMPFVESCDEIVLLVTPSSVSLYCPLDVWASSLQPAFDDANHGGTDEALHVTAHVPSLNISKDNEDAQLNFKLEAVRAMLSRASREAPCAIAGFVALDEAVESWPLLRAACLGSPDLAAAMPPPPDVAEQFVRAARGVCSAAVHPGGWASAAAANLAAGWAALLHKFHRVGDAYDRAELTERFLADAMLTAAAKSAKASEATPSSPGTDADAEGCASGFWAGTRTAKLCAEPSKRRQMRISGAGTNNALHAVTRLVDPAGSGVSFARTLFFSNGAVPHHWQHRVFSDGEVFDPIVEDEVPPVERADESLRLMTLYGVLAAVVNEAAKMVAAACPARVSTTALNRMLHERLAQCIAAKLLPAGFDAVECGAITIRRVLRPVCPSENRSSQETLGFPDDDRGLGPEGGNGGDRPSGAEPDDDDGTDGGKSPAQWYLHVISARLDGVPSVRWHPDVEGSLVFEDTYVLENVASNGALSGGQSAQAVALMRGVPLLTCFPAEGAEESEARQVRGAVEQNNVCLKMHSGIERMRAGEHAQLQVLAAAPEAAVVLTSSPWMPMLKAEVRLFSGGVCIDTPQHGPHVLPFRIHLAAAAYYQIDDRTNAGLVLLRQKPDTHGYGPIALLPESPGTSGEEDGPVDPQDPPLRTLSLAILVPPRSSLQKSLDETVRPLWAQLFEECDIPCDELAAPPAEFEAALNALNGEDVLNEHTAANRPLNVSDN